jgi:L-ascorbate metabolism protein UlaG (beta-lactamase superfamily)
MIDCEDIMKDSFPLIPAHLKDEAFLEDVRRSQLQLDELHLWWLGQSGYLLQWAGSHLLLDPYLSDSLTRKYATTDKPHIRMSERVVDPRRLDFVDGVSSSHSHTDHLDAETLRALSEVNPQLQMVFPEANREVVRERSGLPEDRLLGLNARLPGAGDVGEVGRCADVAKIGPFRIRAVPAAHETLEADAEGRLRYLGYVVEAGPWTVYHSGDTLLYPGMSELLAAMSIDVALLPINGRAPERRVSGNLFGKEAAQLARDMGARIVIPCHYDMFTFNTATPEEFVGACKRLDQGFRVLRAGERWSSGEDPDRVTG